MCVILWTLDLKHKFVFSFECYLDCLKCVGGILIFLIFLNCQLSTLPLLILQSARIYLDIYCMISPCATQYVLLPSAWAPFLFSSRWHHLVKRYLWEHKIRERDLEKLVKLTQNGWNIFVCTTKIQQTYCKIFTHNGYYSVRKYCQTEEHKNLFYQKNSRPL